MPDELFEYTKGTIPVLITVVHNEVLKVGYRPLHIYKDQEIGVLAIAKEIAKNTGAHLLVNKTLTDINEKHDFFKFDRINKDTFMKKIEDINPTVIIDLHGMGDEGPLMNNPTPIGRNFMKVYKDENVNPQTGQRVSGVRPEIDIEFQRKQGVSTAKGITVKELGVFIAKNGVQVGFEMVYPGGNLINESAQLNRECMAIEISRRLRDQSHIKKQEHKEMFKAKQLGLIKGISNYINKISGKEVVEMIALDTFVNNEESFQEAVHAAESEITAPEDGFEQYTA